MNQIEATASNLRKIGYVIGRYNDPIELSEDEALKLANALMRLNKEA